MSKASNVATVEIKSVASAKMMHYPVRAIASDWDYYLNIPNFQRGEVWPESMQQYLIDTILRNYPMNPIIAYENTSKYWITEGQNRLRAIKEFKEGRIHTLNIGQMRKFEPKLEAIEPNRYYHELTDETKNAFDSYVVFFLVTDFKDRDTLTSIYQRFQLGIPLTTGERLLAYESEAVSQALLLGNHPYWTSVYIGKNDRQQLLHACMYVLLMEINPFPTTLSTDALKTLAAGLFDEKITPELIERISSRLNRITHAFAGASARARTDILPIYQASMLLEQAGYDLEASEEGCLSSWFGQIKQKDDPFDKNHYTTFPFLTAIARQEPFWSMHLPLVEKTHGLAKRKE